MESSIAPALVTVESLPSIIYKGQPVITTGHLAQVYGASPANIQDNFRKNQDRFSEGKHYFKLENGTLQAFKIDCPEIFRSVIPARAKNLLFWTARGSARHAKMLNTDTAWEVFEKLEDSFFSKAPAPAQPEPLPLTTPTDRKPLRTLVNVWFRGSALPYNSLWKQIQAHFSIGKIEELPLAWLPDALAFVQTRIDALDQQKALPEPEPVKALSILANPTHSPRGFWNGHHSTIHRALDGYADATKEAYQAMQCRLRRLDDEPHESAFAKDYLTRQLRLGEDLLEASQQATLLAAQLASCLELAGVVRPNPRIRS